MRTETATKETAMPTPSEALVRELDRRINDGFDVRLLWSPRTNQVFVAVEDERHGDAFQFEVDPPGALEAFHHPFAYARDDRVIRLAGTPVCPPGTAC
jgi:hypothetical protein